MFEGVQDQFHQFFAPPPPPQTSLSFSLLHGSLPPSSSPYPIFDTNYPPPPPLHPPTHHQQQQQHHHHQQMVQLQYPPAAVVHSKSVKQEGYERENNNIASGFLSTSLVVERERSSMEADLGQSWSHDEVLALFRVRSSMENWFTWEHVSRKMEEIGFRRSPQKCKEKFEEESRYLHTTTSSTINADDLSYPTKNNYRLFSELEELYHQNDVVLDKRNPQEEDQLQEQNGDYGQGVQDRIGQERLVDENDSTDHYQITIDEIHDEVEKEKGVEKKIGKGHDDDDHGKFELFKGFCEDIVSKMMAHQEELHNKILEDLMKRDEETIAREEAWKKQELERINKEMEARAKDQAMAGDRQAKIIEFLKKFTMINNNNDEANNALQNPSSSATHSSLNYNNNHHIPTSSNDESLSQTSNSLTTHIDPIAPTSNSGQDNKIKPISRNPRPNKRPCSATSDHNYDDTGKRWPREEVLALIKIRCNLDSNNNVGLDNVDGNEGSKNPPLWERISKSMMELGYKRSAKRCKEKWENINKYFRKTKDSKKKRSIDSRTCPYFHQLSHLYNHGRISDGAHGGVGGGDGATLNVDDQGEVSGHVQV